MTNWLLLSIIAIAKWLSDVKMSFLLINCKLSLQNSCCLSGHWVMYNRRFRSRDGRRERSSGERRQAESVWGRVRKSFIKLNVKRICLLFSNLGFRLFIESATGVSAFIFLSRILYSLVITIKSLCLFLFSHNGRSWTSPSSSTSSN